ncbi:NADPH-dependent FMN reductase [Desmospora profundinema]|uniref:FMN reductase n=1 Tax=Desmospora profundinema TaxID=1571184 RepID=A0ABU1IJ18_9BACL|nr:NAD(P)H-dependent oxidoreductase [Desmospora profundinema]MDR6224676.1 FMN reductase [Desmospora profundinema]
MKIVAVSGSMNPESTTRQAVAIVMKAAIEAGAHAELIHLGDWKLPLYDCRTDESTYPEAVHRFRERIKNADGLILGSPQYHGSLSGCLKNALDFIGGKELEGKFVALVGTSGGAMGATNTLNTLNEICRNLHAWPLPSTPSVPRSYEAFLPDGTLKDIQLQKRLEGLGRQLVQVMDRCGERIPVG